MNNTQEQFEQAAERIAKLLDDTFIDLTLTQSKDMAKRILEELQPLLPSTEQLTGETPRTDAEAFKSVVRKGNHADLAEIVNAHFARQLERELNAAKAKLKQYENKET